MKNILTETVFGDALNESKPLHEVLAMLSDLNLINVGELAEQAVSKYSDSPQLARGSIGCDLENGWEIKFGRSNHWPRGNQRMSSVSGFKNKSGVIRAIASETLTNKLYFFKLPERLYRGQKVVKIAFDIKGKPRREPLRATYLDNPWDYEVKNFAELCS